jgi:exosortase/archaeosortase family protein
MNLNRTLNSFILLLKENKRIFYFLVSFLLLYYGVLGYIGIVSKGGMYIEFLDKYLNFIDWYRSILLHGAKLIVELLGYSSQIVDKIYITINNSFVVIIVYSCLGYGIISCWIAFVISNEGNLKFKTIWMILGTMAFVLLNIIRIALMLITNYKNYDFKIPFDHHTLFNISSYLLMFIFAFLYTNKIKKISNNAG